MRSTKKRCGISGLISLLISAAVCDLQIEFSPRRTPTFYFVGEAKIRGSDSPSFVADAHRDGNQRFVARADDKLTAFMELESVIRACGEFT
jgi:hypothetical protein